jgi:putative transcriptional regulator
MDEQLFNDLTESIKEAGRHLRGEIDLPKDQIHFVGEPDPRQVRADMNLTQEAFAALLGISVRTLQNWEQGRREPTGPAMRLLQIAATHPDVLLTLY